jgi:hypothetical protein
MSIPLSVRFRHALQRLRTTLAFNAKPVESLQVEVNALRAALCNLELRTTEVDDRARTRFDDQATLLQTLTIEKSRLVASLGLQEKRLAELFERAQIQSGLK